MRSRGWTLASLSNDASDATFAIAFLQAWAERTCEVGVLRSRGALRDLPTRACGYCGCRGGPVIYRKPRSGARGGVRQIISREARGRAARSSYTYGARRAKAGVGGVDLTVGMGAERPVLSMRRRRGYAENEASQRRSELGDGGAVPRFKVRRPAPSAIRRRGGRYVCAPALLVAHLLCHGVSTSGRTACNCGPAPAIAFSAGCASKPKLAPCRRPW